MSRLALLLLIATALAMSSGAGTVAAREPWHPPLRGATLIGAFTFTRTTPFEPGQRRGIDLRGTPGAAVVAACAGTVTYVGRVPGWGRGVSLRCGGLVATELGLASASVVSGARVWPGAALGRLAARGILRLGARQAGVRHGYVDPLALLGRGGGPAAPTVTPRGGPAVRPRRGDVPPATPIAIARPVTAAAPRATPPVPITLPAPAAAPRATTPVPITLPAPAAAPRAATLPWPAYAGLALLAAGAGGGGMVRRRGRRRRRAGMALAQR